MAVTFVGIYLPAKCTGQILPSARTGASDDFAGTSLTDELCDTCTGRLSLPQLSEAEKIFRPTMELGSRKKCFFLLYGNIKIGSESKKKKKKNR